MKGPVLHPEERCRLRSPDPLVDCFGYKDSVYDTWANCREYAHRYLAEDGVEQRRICYTFNPDHYEVSVEEGRLNIARWFWYLEGHMNWAERTKVHMTQFDHVVFVAFSPGWFQNDISICLATLMLRLGPYCREGSDMAEIMDKHDHSIRTKSAIYRYLEGHQHYTGQHTAETNNGWLCAFDQRDWDEIEQLLIRRAEVERLAAEISVKTVSLLRPQHNDGDSWLLACDRLQTRLRDIPNNDIPRQALQPGEPYFHLRLHRAGADIW